MIEGKVIKRVLVNPSPSKAKLAGVFNNDLVEYKPFLKGQEIWNHWYRDSFYIVRVIHVSEMILIEERTNGSRYRFTKNDLITIWLPLGYEHIYLIGRKKRTALKNCTLQTHQRILDDCLKAENHLSYIYSEESLKAQTPKHYERERN